MILEELDIFSVPLKKFQFQKEEITPLLNEYEEKRDAIISGMRIGLSYALPLNQNHSLKFVAVSGIRFRQGGDFDAVSVVYQYKWIKKQTQPN